MDGFLGSLKVECMIFYAIQRFDGILLIALNWLGSYYFIVHKVGLGLGLGLGLFR